MQLITSKTYSPQLHPILLEKGNWERTKNIQPRKNSLSLQPFGNFRGELSIGENLFDQIFSIYSKEDVLIFRNHPTNSFPRIEIILQKDTSKVKEFKVERSENTVEGELLYTRFFLILADLKKCLLTIKKIDSRPITFTFEELPENEKSYMLRRANLARKLRFLELFFKINFNLPEYFSGNDINQIEILFRALTEGEFKSLTEGSITVFNYKITEDDVKNLSYSKKKPFVFEFNEDLLVLEKFFSVGKMIFQVDKASIANPRTLRTYKIGDVVPQLKLSIFDYQVKHSFEKYLNKERIFKNRQKLEQFKNTLRKVEPEFLVSLIDESLMVITEEIAIEITTGWLQYYDFPDRYSVGEPVLEGENWRVPILLTYPKEKSVWLEDAFVNSKTGNIEIASSPEKLRKKGKKKAEEVFSVV